MNKPNNPPSIKVNIVSHGKENLASHRMRALIPNDLFNTEPGIESVVSQRASLEHNINIFHKHFKKEETRQDAIFSADLTKVMFDICDDHFDHKDHGQYYSDMCDISDAVICNTPNMQKRIYDVTGRLAVICSDPITFPHGTHQYNDSDSPDVLWFGHSANIFSVVPHISKIENLTLITNAVLPNQKCKTKFWKPGLVEKSIDLYDIVIIPRIHTPAAIHKSPNRAVDALYNGRFVIAESEEVYGELMDYAFVGPVQDGIEFYRKNPDKVMEMITAGQRYVSEKYGHEAIKKQWIKALRYED